MTAALPGVTLEVVAPAPTVAPLRSDIAGFVGTTRRGPLGRAVRVTGTTDVQRVFGGLVPTAATGYALRGYFANGGTVAWVVRVGGGSTAVAAWAVGDLPGFPATGYVLAASSPGAWANGLTVRISYRAASVLGSPQVDVRVTAPGEPAELLIGVPPADLPARFTELDLVRLGPEPTAPAPAPGVSTPRAVDWTLTLAGGTDTAPTLGDYRRAAERLADQSEVAIVAAPDLAAHLDEKSRAEVVSTLLDGAAAALDRMVVLDVPPDRGRAPDVVAFVAALRERLEPAQLRAAALYHPLLQVPDPLGSTAAPARPVACSGHVAGVISRLDRQRGAHHSPANAVVEDAVDLDPQLGLEDQVALYQGGVNLVRCLPGQGLRVWGARTLDPSSVGRFLAHRRLVHRLVRAFRAVTLPLVFDVNGPELRLALVRAVTAVLVEAFRAGALAGSRPAEAFQVTCDDTNNPPEQDPGLVMCEAAVAPAVPMEFIRLRLTLAQEGRLEVVEA